ncbi:MAG: hypothetical protein BM564_04570 [Bacteroidetes bacterium MedPE-SWsnd-G2]|nr:MAG: hypothetical protein BM564_04570 [Bacteroidetes bacterium MedPE-SWsnd-G2]
MKTPTDYTFISLTGLREDTFGDEEIFMAIVQLFQESIDEFLEILEKCWPEKQWEELYQATHKIKPNITMFGISSLEQEILNLESLFSSQGNPKDINDLVEKCQSILTQVKLELEAELNNKPHE